MNYLQIKKALKRLPLECVNTEEGREDLAILRDCAKRQKKAYELGNLYIGGYDSINTCDYVKGKRKGHNDLVKHLVEHGILTGSNYMTLGDPYDKVSDKLQKPYSSDYKEEISGSDLLLILLCFLSVILAGLIIIYAGHNLVSILFGI